MQLSRSATLYQERKGLIPTRRGPVPRLAPALNAVFRVPVAPPLPDPWFNPQAPPPDCGATEIWPNGLDGESPQ